jgi:DNA-directed RNA polymerase specialized sigma24 family protein
MSGYQVEVTREDGLWVADIWGPGLGPAATDTVHFADLESEVRDLIAGLTDTEPGDFELTWRYTIGGADMTSTIGRLLEAEVGLQQATQAHDEARRAALRELASTGLSQAAIGDVLGVSHQRVHQLLKAS